MMPYRPRKVTSSACRMVFRGAITDVLPAGALEGSCHCFRFIVPGGGHQSPGGYNDAGDRKDPQPSVTSWYWRGATDRMTVAAGVAIGTCGRYVIRANAGRSTPRTRRFE